MMLWKSGVKAPVNTDNCINIHVNMSDALELSII